MKEISDIFALIGFVYGLAITVAGLKAAIFHNGPYPHELVAMLWRGDIEGK